MTYGTNLPQTKIGRLHKPINICILVPDLRLGFDREIKYLISNEKFYSIIELMIEFYSIIEKIYTMIDIQKLDV